MRLVSAVLAVLGPAGWIVLAAAVAFGGWDPPDWLVVAAFLSQALAMWAWRPR